MFKKYVEAWKGVFKMGKNITETLKANHHELAKIAIDIDRKKALKAAEQAKKESA